MDTIYVAGASTAGNSGKRPLFRSHFVFRPPLLLRLTSRYCTRAVVVLLWPQKQIFDVGTFSFPSRCLNIHFLHKFKLKSKQIKKQQYLFPCYRFSRVNSLSSFCIFLFHDLGSLCDQNRLKKDNQLSLEININLVVLLGHTFNRVYVAITLIFYVILM
jgi:hypothetical protein